MSVSTEADRKLEEAKDLLEQAVQCLSEIVVNKCWGHDDFNEEFRVKIRKAFLDLLKVRDEL